MLCIFSRFQKIKKLAYEFEFPIAWKMYPVVSVAQLEPLPFGENPYPETQPFSRRGNGKRYSV